MTVATPHVEYSLKSLKWLLFCPKMTAKFVDMRSLLKDTYCSDAVVPPCCPSTHWLVLCLCCCAAGAQRIFCQSEIKQPWLYYYCCLHHLQRPCLMDALPWSAFGHFNDWKAFKMNVWDYVYQIWPWHIPGIQCTRSPVIFFFLNFRSTFVVVVVGYICFINYYE